LPAVILGGSLFLLLGYSCYDHWPNVGEAVTVLHDVWFSFYLLVWYVLYLAICGRAATLFTSEKEGQTLPLLLASPLSDAAILRGKYLVLIREYGPCACCLPVMNLVVSLWLWASGREHDFPDIGMPVYLLWTTFGPLVRLVYFATVALWWSVVSSSSTRASSANIASQLALHFAALFLGSQAGSKHELMGFVIFCYIGQLFLDLLAFAWMKGHLSTHGHKFAHSFSLSFSAV
jgi:ABC-type transport system involved in multi-copper enzyme maturation permease subunit